jgi:hypothetical protein
MKLYFNIFLQIFIFFKLCNGLDRLWLIRHCDKPKSSKNPCCSELGYERAKNWYHYFKIHFKKNSIIKIYSSNFNEKKVCINNILYNPNSNCQKSQRMFLTAYYLQETLQKFYKFQENININFCVGEKNKLVNSILDNYKVSDVILVWEHKEIIDIIRHFQIEIKKWKNKFENTYNLVFMIDIKTKQLFYDCFDFVKNNTYCSNDIDIWLNKFNRISNKGLILYNNSLNKSNKSNVNYIASIFCLFLLIILLLCYLIIAVINLIILRRRRREYTIII